MPSFDVVSEVNLQEVDNAVNQTEKEIGQRYDFKGKKFELTLDKDKVTLMLAADEEGRLNALFDVLSSRLIKRGIDLGSLDVGKQEPAGGMMIRQKIGIKQGLEAETAKKVVKIIKEMKLKVEAQVQDSQVRVSGKNIDDLQTVMANLKQKGAEVGVPLQFNNMRR